MKARKCGSVLELLFYGFQWFSNGLQWVSVDSLSKSIAFDGNWRPKKWQLRKAAVHIFSFRRQGSWDLHIWSQPRFICCLKHPQRIFDEKSDKSRFWCRFRRPLDEQNLHWVSIVPHCNLLKGLVNIWPGFWPKNLATKSMARGFLARDFGTENTVTTGTQKYSFTRLPG